MNKHIQQNMLTLFAQQLTPLLFLFLLGCDKKSGGGNDIVPTASIADVTVTEGNSGSTSAAMTVTLSGATSKVVTITYSTIEGTAKAGSDFTAVSNGTVTLQPNETSKVINIPVSGEELRESDESFTVIISASNATVQRNMATVTIQNDDTRILFTNAGYDAPTSYQGYSLVWKDDFDGPALDQSAWSFENGDGCPNVCGWGNNELEYYRPENLSFQEGKMIIEARPEAFGGKNYTSTKILTRGKKVFKFGRIDIRAKLPRGKGIWPAFWLLPQNNTFGGWPRSGELDLMELVGHEPGKVYGTLHFGPGPGSTQIGKNYSLPSGTFNDEFHVFSIEWKQDQIKWLVDGNVYGTANKADFGTNNYPFNEDFFLIFNLAVGGNWPGSPDATTSFPQWLIVDYVRVYQ
jgi:beta-glucanase (GH16 family)